MGIGVGITSFDKALYVGIMSDPTIIDDVEAIARGFASEFDDLRRIAGVAPIDLHDIGVAPAGNGHAHNGNGNGAGSNGASATATKRRARTKRRTARA
jgi:hypothetical protein